MSATTQADVTGSAPTETASDEHIVSEHLASVPDEIEPSTESLVSTFAEDQAVDDAAVEVESIAGAINELQSRLEKANSRILEAKRVQSTEEEIGRLFVQAQQFTDTAIIELEEQAHKAIEEAEAEAGRIVAGAQHQAAELVKTQIRQVIEAAEVQAAAIIEEANRRAEEIISEARAISPIPTETAQQLRATIDGFSRVNRELVDELSFLNGVLAGDIQPQIGDGTDVGIAAVELGNIPPALRQEQSPDIRELPQASE